MSSSDVTLLKTDLLNIDKALSSILSHAQSVSPAIAQCPSRKYPSRLAKDISSSVEESIICNNNNNVDTQLHTEYTKLLDLILDRLSFLMQCTVSILGSNMPPLSLGSAVKKLSQLLTTSHPVAKCSNTSLPSSNGTPTTSKMNTGEMRSTSTQTVETSFSTCVNCSDMQNILLDIACSFTEAFHKLNTPSKVDENILSSYDIDSQDIISTDKWINSFEQDINSFSDVLYSLKTKVTQQEFEMKEVKTNLQSRLSEVRHLETKLIQITRDAEQSQASLEIKLNQSNTKFQNELELLSKERDTMKIENESLISNLKCQNEAKDSNTLSNNKLKTEIIEMEAKMKESLNEIQLITAKCHTLEVRANQREEEKQSLIDQIENMTVTIKKLEVQCNTMKQHEGKLKNKCDTLIKQISSISEDYSKLQDTWSTSTDENGRFKQEIVEKEAAIMEIKTNLANQEKIIETLKERDLSYSEQVQKLKVSLLAVKKKLDAADEKCRLLMKFPELFPVADKIADIHEKLLANSLKIMLLEQNSAQLRQENLKHSLSNTDSSQDFTLVEPTPLWHMESLDKLKREFSSRLNSTSSAERLDNLQYLPEDDTKSRAKSRGRCGQLKEALAHVNSQEECSESSPQRSNVKLVWSEQLISNSTSSSKSNVLNVGELDKSASELMSKQVHTCQKCDSMFYDFSSLITHNQHCYSVIPLTTNKSL